MQKNDYGSEDAWLAELQGHFDQLIRTTLASYDLAVPEVTPVLTSLRLSTEEKAYLPVSGMFGGFSYWPGLSNGQRCLIVESWSRTVEGSRLRHAITPDGAILLDQGFV